MKKFVKLAALPAFVGAMILGNLSAKAVPIQFGSNAYELILVANPYTGTNNSWGTADSAAQASMFMGASGHLATVTSLAENNFLANLAIAAAAPLEPAGFTGAWLGGRAGPGWLAGPENGTPFTYTNFGGAEPNNLGFVYMAISLNPGAAGLTAVGEWLDDTNAFPAPLADPVVGYFVEYENVFPVPEPGTLALFGLGLAGLGFARRRRASA